MKIKVFIFIVSLSICTKLTAQNRYACFQDEKNKKIQLYISFKKDKAVTIKYKGQKKIIPLQYITTEQTDSGAGSPSFFWKETYAVKTGKRIMGNYILTNGGAYELQLSYIDKRTSRKNNFVIIPASAGENFYPYRNTPCF